MSPSVSIVIPVYMVDKYLAYCLDSVLSQTLTDIEVICINDYSPDECSEILSVYSKKDDRIKVINQEKVKGQSRARNMGIDLAAGEYIYFLDPDDLFFSSSSLEHLYSIAKLDNADEVIGAILRWDEKTEERTFGYHTTFLKRELRGELFKNYQFLRSNVTGCNKLLKRSFLDKSGIRFNEELKKFEDNPFSWKIHLLASSISLTVQATYLHRQRLETGPKSIMQSKEEDVRYHVGAAYDMMEFFDHHPELTTLRHNCDRYYYYWLSMDVQEIRKDALSFEQKKTFLGRYLSVLNKIPEASRQVMPDQYRNIQSLIDDGEVEKSWAGILLAGEKVSELNDSPELKSIQDEIDLVCSSLSWRITAPLRKVMRRIGSAG